jgi:hypothetical protein
MSRDFAGGVATDRVIITNYAAVNALTDFTVSVWVNPTTLDTVERRMVAKANTNAAGDGLFYLAARSTDISFQAGRWQTNPGNWYADTFDLTLNVWTHVLVTYSYSNAANTPVGYLNGSSHTFVVDPGSVPSGTLLAETVDIGIGNRAAGTFNRAWDGLENHPAIFASILGAPDIALLATGADPRLCSVQPVFYMQIGDNSPEPNLISAANTGVVTGATKGNTDPVYIGAPATALILNTATTLRW